MNQYKFNILGVADWFPQNCKASGTALSGAYGQITKCVSDLDDTFYVRENIDGTSSFYVSSGERWGWKTHGRVSKRHQVLELCVQNDITQTAKDYIWYITKQAVLDDPLRRQLIWNTKLTAEWCEQFVYN